MNVLLDPRFTAKMIVMGLLLLVLSLANAWVNWRRGSALVWISLGTTLVIAAVLAFNLKLYYFPLGAFLRPDAKGIIHHPWYGDYPAVVPFRQGMTLMPGQEAMGVFEVRPEKQQWERNGLNGAL